MRKKGVREEDISNRAVMLMLVLVMLVSVISLGAYLNALEKVKSNFFLSGNKATSWEPRSLLTPPGVMKAQASGMATVQIIDPMEKNETRLG